MDADRCDGNGVFVEIAPGVTHVALAKLRNFRRDQAPSLDEQSCPGDSSGAVTARLIKFSQLHPSIDRERWYSARGATNVEDHPSVSRKSKRPALHFLASILVVVYSDRRGVFDSDRIMRIWQSYC